MCENPGKPSPMGRVTCRLYLPVYIATVNSFCVDVLLATKLSYVFRGSPAHIQKRLVADQKDAEICYTTL